MLYLSNDEIDRLIKEDVPYIDLTSWSLGIKEQKGRMIYFTREDTVVCGTEEVRKIFERLYIETDFLVPSGQKIKVGDNLIVGKGKAENLHIAWKVGQNILDHCSGIANKTRRLVDIAKKYNPSIAILTTRKGFPGTKALAIKSIMAGGAMPHRLGLSETVLVFKQHMNFIGGFDNLLKKINHIKIECCEKKIIVETACLKEAEALCKAGADGIQFDKLTAEELKKSVDYLVNKFPDVIMLGAGGINESNIADYAQTGINGIVTSNLYNAKPIDIGVKIEKEEL